MLRQKDTAQNNAKQEHPVHSNLTILSISFIKISKVCTSTAGPGRQSGQDVKVTTHLYLILRLRIYGVMPLLASLLFSG